MRTPPAVPLVGRVEELARISVLLAEAQGGRAGVLAIRGEPGAGKTRLLDEACRQAHGCRLLAIRGVPDESSFAYSALDRLLRPVHELTGELSATEAQALAAALGTGAVEPADPLAVCTATLDLLAGAADEQPLLILVDDLQWIDADTRRVLLFLARRLDAERLALLLAVRAGSPAAELPDIPVLDLQSLSPADARQLVAAQLPAAPSQVLAQAHAATGGNPLALLRWAQALDAGTRMPPPVVALGTDIERSFADEIATLGVAAQKAVALAALLDGQPVQRLLSALQRQKLPLSAIEQAESRRLVDLSTGEVTFVHPLARAAVLAAVAPAAVREAHATLADLTDVSNDTREQESRVWHRALAVVGPDGECAAALADIGDLARSRGSSAAAAAAYEQAARLAEQPAERAMLLLQAGEAILDTGDSNRAAARLDEAQPLLTAIAKRPRVELLRARIEVAQGQPEAALLRLRELTETESPWQAPALEEAITAAIWTGDLRRGVRLARKAVAVAPPELAAKTSILLAGALAISGAISEAAPLLDQLDVAAESGMLPGQALLWLAAWNSFADRDQAAGRYLSAALVYAREHGAGSLLPMVRYGQAVTATLSGDWDAATARASEAASLAATLGRTLDEMSARAIGSYCWAGRGDQSRTERDAVPALAWAVDNHARSVEAQSSSGLGRLWLSLGRPEDALPFLLQAQDASSLGLRLVGHFAWASDLVEVALVTGHGAKVRQALDWLRAAADDLGQPSAAPLAERVMGLLNPDGADRHFEKSLALHQRLPRPYEHARTLLCYGEWLRRNRRPKQARERLAEAHRIFQRLKAQPWAERAARELSAAGGVAAPAQLPDVGLSAREMQVARELAGGATLREAAATLFLSPKTVDHHLRGVYQKLGINSRTQLAEKLDPQREAGPVS